MTRHIEDIDAVLDDPHGFFDKVKDRVTNDVIGEVSAQYKWGKFWLKFGVYSFIFFMISLGLGVLVGLYNVIS